ncbi:MAG TPA: DUF4215 domain-containing protein [Polyangiaceae bacterium]|nr:DUF4215 domain-containing protein [Polyangiaceae bacterium]
MISKYWLPLSLVASAAGFPAACSPKFTACDASRSCGPGGAGGGIGDGGTGGEAGSDLADAGDSSVPDDSSSAGDAGAGADGEAGAGGEGGSVAPNLSGACTAAQQIACDGHATAQRLACDGSKWIAAPTCAAGKLCDSSSGQCVKVVPECANAVSGAAVCRGDRVLSCGVDLVTAAEGETCTGLCKDGACQAPVCGDQKVEPGEECENDENSPGACIKCKKAICGDGVVWAAQDHEQCDDGNTLSGDGCSATCRVETRAIALGGSTTCALSYAGQVKCWGDNDHGVLGVADTNPLGKFPNQVPKLLKPIDLGTDRKASAISVSGGNSACALLDHGEVKCWGNNQSGQLGTGTSKDDRGDGPNEMGDALPAVSLGRKALSVSAGSDYTCAVLDDGSVKCWGSGRLGQLGGDSPYDALLPAEFVTVGLKRPATAVSASNGVTCAILDDGTLRCWGDARYVPASDLAYVDADKSGGVGDYSAEIGNLSALTFKGAYQAKAVFTGAVSGAILNSGWLMLWGVGYGWLNAGVPPNDFASLSPINMGGNRKVTSADADIYHACAVTDDGALSCWGYAYHGALGLGSVLSSPGPVTVSSSGEITSSRFVDLGGRKAIQVAVGEQHTCALLDDRTLKCWGYNASGQLGLGNFDDKLSADTTVDLSF